MKRYAIILFLMALVSGIPQVYAQEKQKIPADFFLGKWGGTISGEVVDKQPHQPVKKYPFNMELIGHPAKLGIGPFGGGAEAWMKMTATWPDKFTLVDTSVGCFLTFVPDYPIFNIEYPISDPASIAEIGYNGIFSLGGFTVQVENKDLIHLTSGGADPDMWGDSWAKGELYRTYTRKDTLGKTVFINEPIKTDKFTQREIVVPNVGEVVVNTNSECKFNTDKELEQMMGEIYKRIKKLPPDDFKVRTPQAVCGVRGTQFITKVNGDTTTITVYEGEVEFSDINKKKTVIVRSNQTSFCTNGGQPIEPLNIDPKQALKWWE